MTLYFKPLAPTATIKPVITSKNPPNYPLGKYYLYKSMSVIWSVYYCSHILFVITTECSTYTVLSSRDRAQGEHRGNLTKCDKNDLTKVLYYLIQLTRPSSLIFCHKAFSKKLERKLSSALSTFDATFPLPPLPLSTRNHFSR